METTTRSGFEPAVTERLARIEERLSTITSQLSQLATLLMGTEGHPGLVVRLDRIEQAEGRRTKFLWVAISASMAALAKSATVW